MKIYLFMIGIYKYIVCILSLYIYMPSITQLVVVWGGTYHSSLSVCSSASKFTTIEIYFTILIKNNKVYQGLPRVTRVWPQVIFSLAELRRILIYCYFNLWLLVDFYFIYHYSYCTTFLLQNNIFVYVIKWIFLVFHFKYL